MHILFATMNRLSKITILPAILLAAFPLYAQKQWTLQECIKYALENNLTIQQQTLAIERDKNQLEQSKWAMAPNVGARTGYNFSWGRTVNQQDLTIIENKLSQSGTASISADLDLFRGQQKINTIKSNQVQLEISAQQVEKIKNDISIQITRTFLQVILAQEMLETARQSRQSVREQVERIRKLVDAGNLAHSNLLEIQAQLASEQVQAVNAEISLRSNYLNLIQLLDLSTETDFLISIPSIQVDTLGFSGAPIDLLYQTSQSLPDIQIGEFTLQQREYQLAISKGQRFPSLSFSAGISTSYNPEHPSDFFRQLNERKTPGIGLSLNIPILSGRTISTNIRNAALGVKQAQIDMKNKQQALYKEIQQANNDAMSAFERYRATLQNVKSMEESFRYVQQKLDVGLLNGTDFTVAKTNLFRAQSDNLQAKYQYVFQLKILDFYRGIPITL